MLTLSADAACDVCAEEYGPFNLPRSIPCGHVLCATCAETIIERASSSPKHAPQCPYCRESFSRDAVRVIRIDFSGTSGGGSSSGVNGGIDGSGGDGFGATLLDGGAPFNLNALNAMDDEMVLYDVRKTRSPSHSAYSSRDPSRATSPERPHPNGIFVTINEDAHKERARELEKKVAKVATKRCTVEEIQALQRELADWLSNDKNLGSNGMSAIDKQQHAAIYLSHLLLKAILMNHVAFSEVNKVAKGIETNLRSRLADGDLIREKLDEDLRKAKKELAGRMQEIMALRSELARLRGGEEPQYQQHNNVDYAQAHAGAGAVTPTRRQSLSAPTSPDGSSTGYFPSFALFSSTSSASTAVPPPRSNPSSGANSPCSSGRTTPTAGLALGLGLGGGMSGSMMPMGSNFPPNTIGMTLSSAGLGPGPNNSGDRNDRFMTTSGGMSSASSAAAHHQKTFTISGPPPTRSQSTVPGAVRPGTGTSSASASASANSTPARPQSTVPARSSTPASPSRYGTHSGHGRSASMIHRSVTVVPGLSSSSASSASASAAAANSTSHSNASASANVTTMGTPSRDRRSVTPAPVHQRSASVAPGAMSSASSASRSLGMTLGRSMTPNPSSRPSSSKETGQNPNGSSAGGASASLYSSASGIPPVPALPSSSSSSSYSSSTTGLSRPPVPPKPRTLSQSPSQGRGVIDDRDGYATEKELTTPSKKEKKERSRHERWLPANLMDRITRPSTSIG